MRKKSLKCISVSNTESPNSQMTEKSLNDKTSTLNTLTNTESLKTLPKKSVSNNSSIKSDQSQKSLQSIEEILSTKSDLNH